MSFRYPHPGTEQAFERFCLKLLQRHWANRQLKLYGRRGDAQFGVDILDESWSKPFRAGQCKHHEPDKTIPPAEIQAEVEKALTFSPPLEFFTILTTAKATTFARDKVLEINKKHRAQGLFIVELLDWGDVEDLLEDYPDVVASLTPVKNAHLVELSEAMAGGFGRISTQFDAATATMGRSTFDAEIDEAEAHLKGHDPQRARIFLERIRQRHGGELSPHQKYRILIGLSNAALAEGKDSDAGRLLLEAKDAWPNGERARINEALGLEMVGDKDGAHALAAERLRTYPSSATLLACLIRTAPATSPLDELEGLLTRAHAGDEQVRAALTLRATAAGDFWKAEAHARAAIEANPDWFGPRVLLGQALLKQESAKLGRSIWAGPDPVVPNRLREAASVMDEAIAMVRRQKAHHCLADALSIRATARTLLGEYDAAECDFGEAIRREPDHPGARLVYARFLIHRGRDDEAITLLRQARPTDEVEYLLASILEARDGTSDRREAADVHMRLALRQEAAGDEDLAAASFHQAVRELLDEGRLDEAGDFIARIPPGRLDEVAVLSARSAVLLASGDLPEASRIADEALGLVRPDTRAADLRGLALQLGTLERHRDALPLWKKVSESVGYGEEIRHLVVCAERAGRPDVVMKVGRAAREFGIGDPWLFFREVDTLAAYSPDEAVSLLRGWIESHPEDKPARLRLSLMGIKWGRPELIDARTGSLPPVEEASPNDGAVAVEILRKHGDVGEAMRYAYELSRRYPDHPGANAAIMKVVLDPTSRPPEAAAMNEVMVGSAVLCDEGDGRERWIVIEDSPNPRPELGEFPPGHPTADALIGRRVGDTVTLSRTSARDRTAVIKEVQSKYVRKFREAAEGWQIRFQDHPLVQVFRVVTTDPATGQDVPDLTDLKMIADRRAERTAEAESTYKQHVLSLNLFANWLGCSPFWAIFYAASKPDLPIRSNRGRDDEQEAALGALESVHTLVLDLTALGLIRLLRLEGLLEKWRGKLLVSQSTAAEIRSVLEEVSTREAKHAHFGKGEMGYYIAEVDAELARDEADRFRTFAEAVLRACEVRVCPELAAIAPETRDQLVAVFGQHGVESMLLARAPGHALWTDDLAVADVAATEFAVRRVWTQPALVHAATVGIISPDELVAASATLLGIGYESTVFDPAVVVKAASLSEWDAGTWPFSRALQEFAKPSVPDNQVLLFSATLVMGLFKSPTLAEKRQTTFLAILERMASRTNGLAIASVLIETLPRLLGVNVLAADEAQEIGRAWLAEATRRVRLIPHPPLEGRSA